MKLLHKYLLLLAFLTPLLPAEAQFLSLSWPLDRSVIQQTGGSASVYVAGQLIGCPDSYDRLQMRIEKLDKYGAYSSLIQDYSDISRDNGGLGIFYQEAYLANGWYRILVKAINSGGGIVAINDVKVGVGNVFIIAGQSNASGITDTNGVPANLPSDAAYDCVVSNDWLGNCDWKTSPAPAYVPYPLFPVFSKISMSSKIAPHGYNRWAYSRLGNLQVDGTNGAVAFFNVGSHTTDIAAWRTSADGGAVTGMPYIGHVCSGIPNNLPNNTGLPYKRLQQAVNYYASLFGSRGILWHQGEAETEHQVASSTYNSDYVNKLNYVISKSRTQYGYTIPWFVSKSATLISKYTSSTWTYDIKNTTVQGNQNTVAASNSNGASTDAYNKDYRHPQDFTHLNENASYQGLTKLADSWNSGIGTSGGGIAAQTVPPITLSYNSSTDVYTAYAPSGYADYKWVVGNGELDRGVGTGSSASSMALAGAGVRCWVKNSTGNWRLTPLVYAQTCRSGARLGAGDGTHSDHPSNEEIFNLTLSPNPGADHVNIRFNLPNSAHVSINIINENGQVLQKVVANQHGKGSFNYPINVSGLQDGIYLCQLKANDISLVKKLLVKK